MKNFTDFPRVQKLVNSTPMMLNSANHNHIVCFKLLIELAYAQFRWGSHIALIS